MLTRAYFKINSALAKFMAEPPLVCTALGLMIQHVAALVAEDSENITAQLVPAAPALNVRPLRDKGDEADERRAPAATFAHPPTLEISVMSKKILEGAPPTATRAWKIHDGPPRIPI